MADIKILLYPYGSEEIEDEEPIEMEIENKPEAFKQYLEGRYTEIDLVDSFVQLFNDEIDTEEESYKFQKKYGVPGNFIISKKEGSNFVTLTSEDIKYIKEYLKNNER